MRPTGVDASEILPSARSIADPYVQRIPFPAVSPDERGVYGALTYGQQIAGHLNPAVRAGIGAQSGALLRDGSLPPRLRELIIVRTGYQAGSVYEVVQHRSLAERLGVPAATLDALACIEPQGLQAHEAAAIAFVDELLTRNRPRDEILAAVRSHFDDAQVLEMIFVTGNWWTLARMLETAGVPLDGARIGDSGVAPRG